MNIGVLLSGCGVGDGSQIEEVILTYLALDKYGVDYICFAQDKSQYHTFNHLNEKVEESENRNILKESARIGRGRIKTLDDISIDELDGLVLPGGVGVFKNLSNYILEKENFVVDKDVDKLIKDMYLSKKPIAAMCGATVLIAKSLGNETKQLELCTSNNAHRKILEMNNVIVKEVNSREAYVDIQNRIVTTPAFLGTQNLYEIKIGIDRMVREFIELIG
ncbi:isoprenoid biosynthesis glyoxalase ElbB [Tissierella carlieri]|uniref:isoprenoid biosynthesis glyoxalase ElbB n=1 Tax=Tissierella carlieri TaxID=689904 RepID=UPI001C0F7E00|nr:isoprenoid biosynthesis glyoxalase ElbB [Tissierella carlieri]MBU5313825.1 isoprenoid biosynthesis glyoxalase ElbB [Tissierella carlieri]